MTKKPKSSLFFLYHIKESIEAIAIHIQGGKESFLTNRTVHSQQRRGAWGAPID